MGIDAITLVAQVINLLLLIWLLKRFLYTPILKAVDARQAKIAQQLDEARRQAEQAKGEQQLYADKVNALENQRQMLIKEARTQADALRESMVEKAKTDIAYAHRRWKDDLMLQKQGFEDSLIDTIVQQFDVFANGALTQLAGVSLHQLMTDEFLRRLAALSVREKRSFEKATQATGALTLWMAQLDNKARLVKAVEKTLDLKGIRLSVKEDKTLMSGVSLVAGEVVLSWNLKDYMAHFKSQLDANLTQKIEQG